MSETTSVPTIEELDDALELAWGIIANASGGNWEKESPEWQEAAARWRDNVMPALSRRAADRAKPESAHAV